MAPRLISCYFGDNEQYLRMARVLAYSADLHCRAWEREVVRINPPELVDPLATDGYIANTQKLDYWCDRVEQSPDGAELLLIDSDTVLLRDLDDVWQFPFDLAYTMRTGSRFPFNAGVIFLRASDRTRAFVRAWREENTRMFRDPRHHRPWRKRFGGMNQASLGYVLESGYAADLTLAELPCVEWNCEDSAWHAFDPARTRILHVKSLLRLAIFQGAPGTASPRHLVQLWRSYERAAIVAEARTA